MAKGATLECDVSDAVAVSAAVWEQLSVDACACTFSLSDVGVLKSLRCVISGSAVSDERSLSTLGRQLCNQMLELQGVCPGTDRFDLNSIDLSSLSVDALDQILTEGSFDIKSEDDLLSRLSRLGSEYAPLLRHIEIGFLSVAALAECTAFPPEWIWNGISRFLVPAVDSVIISDFPEIFSEFCGERFSLLWRGGRDGFRARDFHRLCDGHASTLTLIEDTNGNIFGGFTPLEWESRTRSPYKADASLKSFIFTLKNPHNVPARRFALKAKKKDEAILCRPEWGPCFGGDFVLGLGDIGVSDNCKARTDSETLLGYSYTNDTGLDGKAFFTGSWKFQVKEIEVFEITDTTVTPTSPIFERWRKASSELRSAVRFN
jgi:hypothetical protein